MIEIRYWLEEHKKQIIILLGSILGIVIGFLIYFCVHYTEIKNEKKKVEDIPIEINLKEDERVVKEETEKTKIIVDIKGAVKNPGVYEVEEGKRVQDIIEMASGLNESADISLINLSKKVTDEMVIVIYTKEEVEKQKNSEIDINAPSCPETPIINDACIENNEPSQVQEETKKVSINEASLEELMKLPGIGESKAQAIIKYREENGAFQTIEEIKNVSGIGEAVFAKMESYIIV